MSYPPCGTYAAYRRHVRRDEPPCVDCKAAAATYRRLQRRRKGVKPFRTARCGTLAGRTAHFRRKESVCDLCRQAFADYQRAYRRGEMISRRHDQPTISDLIIDVLETFGYAMTRQVIADHVTRIRPEWEHRSVVTTALRMAGAGELMEKEPGHWWIA